LGKQNENKEQEKKKTVGQRNEHKLPPTVRNTNDEIDISLLLLLFLFLFFFKVEEDDRYWRRRTNPVRYEP